MSVDSYGDLNIDWDTDDESTNFHAASMSSSCPNLHLIQHFVNMGFSENLVVKAINENGKDNAELILESLLTYSALESILPVNPVLDIVALESNHPENSAFDYVALESNHPENHVLDIVAVESSHPENHVLDIVAFEGTCEENPTHDDSDFSSDYECLDFSDFDSSENEDISEASASEKRQKLLFLEDMGFPVEEASDKRQKLLFLEDMKFPVEESSEKKQKLLFLEDMGFPIEEASIALERCGSEASVAVLTDFLTAAQMARATDATLPSEIKVLPSTSSSFSKKRKIHLCRDRRRAGQDDEMIRLPNPMIGFGVPSGPNPVVRRNLPEGAAAPPFFYYENVALAPKGVWQTITRFLYDIEPEFVDSKYFCAAARKRGYIHNLPIDGRFPLLPLQPSTIHDALPSTRRWWPRWDERTKLNCLQTVCGSAKLTDRILKMIENWETVPPLEVQKEVIFQCKKWNLVWVGKNKVAPLEPDEFEMLLGFPKNHTRGGGISRTERFKSLGNSFQVDTVAYHLSVLKDLFPDGINVLSLFSGIGGAEVALHRLGIHLKTVVSVDISVTNRSIQRCWWEQTNQRGVLLDIGDVQELTTERLEELIRRYGGFDLVVGGSPCNNLAGSNRIHRSGLEGKESSLFFDYYRILDTVKSIMGKRL